MILISLCMVVMFKFLDPGGPFEIVERDVPEPDASQVTYQSSSMWYLPW